MMIYQYRCRRCGATELSEARADTLGLCQCEGELRRDYSGVQLAPVMQEHYNPSIDGMISSERKLNERFKIASDEYSQRTGIEARFAPVDPKDAGATQQGLEATNRVRHARGLKEVNLG